MKEQKYLLTFKACWADEFDWRGQIVLDQLHIDAIEDALKNLDEKKGRAERFYYGFGTNEEFDWDNSDEMREDFSYQKISKEHAEVLEQYLDSTEIISFVYQLLEDFISDDFKGIDTIFDRDNPYLKYSKHY